MIKQFRHQDLLWIDATNPTKDELTKLAKDYGIHSLVENELATPSSRSHADLYENYIYTVLHLPACYYCKSVDTPKKNKKTKEADKIKENEEIDFILGKDFLITIHYEPIQALDEFGQIFEANFGTNSPTPNHSGYLFFNILMQLYHSLDVGLVFIGDELKKAEKNIFEGKEKEMVIVLSDINRKFLDFRWALKSHPEVLSSLEPALLEFFGEEYRHYLRTLNGAFQKISYSLESLKETFVELRTTNDSLLTIKTNEIMKILTIMAFTTFPLTVFTSTFGMNTQNTPILGRPYDFWIIVAIMLVSVAFMFTFFRHKRWI